MDLLQEYPPQVWNPALGKHFLALWWTEHDQNHVIVSQDEEGAAYTFGVVLSKNPDAEIRQCLDATLVPCPEDVALRWARARHDRELEVFGFHIFHLAVQSKEATGKAPKGFHSCNHREESNARWNCRKCNGRGLYADTPTIRALFAVPEVRAMFREDRRQQALKHRNHDPQPALAAMTKDPCPEDLQIAVLKAGNHSDGVVFMSLGEWEDYSTSEGRLPVLFFFRGKGIPTPPALLEMVEVERQKQKAEAERYHEGYNRKLKAALKEEAQVLQRILAYLPD